MNDEIASFSQIIELFVVYQDYYVGKKVCWSSSSNVYYLFKIKQLCLCFNFYFRPTGNAYRNIFP